MVDGGIWKVLKVAGIGAESIGFDANRPNALPLASNTHYLIFISYHPSTVSQFLSPKSIYITSMMESSGSNYNHPPPTINSQTRQLDGEDEVKDETEETITRSVNNPTDTNIIKPTAPRYVPTVWPIRPHLVLEFARSKILRLWPYCHINGYSTQPSPHHPPASRYWVVSADNLDVFEASLGDSYLSRFGRSGARWQRYSRLSATLAWNGLKNACSNVRLHGDARRSSRRTREGLGMLNLAERKWLLGLLFNQLSFNVPQRWMSHVQIEESLPADYTVWLLRHDIPWIRIRYPQGSLCISIGDELPR
ncbi:hypothetical protein TWF481_011787 [Arthrobotrys musiformis]|uniref:Uncharacterized protein n=1 Tax=Arthrobotrys musiformis TaxID=47236 RepID=A0AAV9VX75_9PEZI